MLHLPSKNLQLKKTKTAKTCCDGKLAENFKLRDSLDEMLKLFKKIVLQAIKKFNLREHNSINHALHQATSHRPNLNYARISIFSRKLHRLTITAKSAWLVFQVAVLVTSTSPISTYPFNCGINDVSIFIREACRDSPFIELPDCSRNWLEKRCEGMQFLDNCYPQQSRDAMYRLFIVELCNFSLRIVF